MTKSHCINNLNFIVQYYGPQDKKWHDMAAFPYAVSARGYASSCKLEQPEYEWRVTEREISEVTRWTF